ncbi:hypothetical protein [Chryseobacterium indoltheticum]|uniref:hypothetical protein n=1 Tax=Chryseobacterium indoltheticum TaxID=254 RepID=UPI003F49786E
MPYLMTKLYFLLSALSVTFLFSQKKDSVNLISEVQIDAYKKPTPFIVSTKSVSVISKNLLNQNTPERMLESFNQIAGARMEERSPEVTEFRFVGVLYAHLLALEM